MSDKMNTFKKTLTVAIILLFISVARSSSINANISKASVESELVEVSTEICGLNDENVTIHMFCYIKSGEVEHRNWKGTFYGIPIKIGTGVGTFGIGSFYMHLKGEGDELRLTVSKILRTTTYTQDVNVGVKGFIGVFQPTGGISGGLLFGFSLITQVYFL